MIGWMHYQRSGCRARRRFANVSPAPLDNLVSTPVALGLVGGVPAQAQQQGIPGLRFGAPCILQRQGMEDAQR